MAEQPIKPVVKAEAASKAVTPPAPAAQAKPAVAAEAKPTPAVAAKPLPTAAAKPVAATPAPTAPAVAKASPAAAPTAKAKGKPGPKAKRAAPAKAVPARPARKAPVRVSTKPDTAAVKAAKTPIKGLKTMATTAETVTAETNAKLQGAFADVQGRAKSAMEKGARFYEEMGDFTKGNVEAVIASSRVAASAMESLGQDAAAYGKKSLEQAQATFKNAAAVKSPTELFQLQSDYARAAFDALVAQGSAMTEKMMKLSGEVVQPLSSRFAVAAEKVKSAAL